MTPGSYYVMRGLLALFLGYALARTFAILLT